MPAAAEAVSVVRQPVSVPVTPVMPTGKVAGGVPVKVGLPRYGWDPVTVTVTWAGTTVNPPSVTVIR